MVRHPFFSLVAVVFTLSCAAVVDAQMVISANDGAAVLVNGVNTVPSPARPDSVTILDATVTPPRVVSELAVPNSVIGPPQNVAIAPDGSIAVVTSSTKIDPDDEGRTQLLWENETGVLEERPFFSSNPGVAISHSPEDVDDDGILGTSVSAHDTRWCRPPSRPVILNSRL